LRRISSLAVAVAVVAGGGVLAAAPVSAAPKAFLRPDAQSAITDTCGGLPCFAGGFTGP
jgi:hypothetical protein